MTEITHVKTFTIGGKECHAVVRYRDVFRFAKGLRREVLRYKDTPLADIVVRHKYYFDVVWKCLIKTGPPWDRYPFRSKRHMIKNMAFEELEEVTMFVSKNVLPAIYSLHGVQVKKNGENSETLQ